MAPCLSTCSDGCSADDMGGDHKKEEPTIDPEIDNEEIIDDVEEIVL